MHDNIPNFVLASIRRWGATNFFSAGSELYVKSCKISALTGDKVQSLVNHVTVSIIMQSNERHTHSRQNNFEKRRSSQKSFINPVLFALLASLSLLITQNWRWHRRWLSCCSWQMRWRVFGCCHISYCALSGWHHGALRLETIGLQSLHEIEKVVIRNRRSNWPT
jgi:hypothetical protein